MKATAFALLLCMIAGAAAAARLPTFMAGAWVGGSHEGDQTEEHWMDAAGGMMLGMGRKVDTAGNVTYEFLRIAPHEGTIAYFAMPQGRPAIAFPLKSINPSKVVFENRSHDYPQRITYWVGNAELCARIEGTIKGRAASEQWCWSRLKP